MSIRLEVDIAFNCRPKKGERRAKDGTGRLVKCSIYFGASIAECLGEARSARKAADKHAPGYSEVIAVRAYDREAFSADPLKAVPTYQGAAL
jgi:hypothetical protein